jgi:hypothetical protein
MKKEMEVIEVTLKGVAPLIMHNIQLADPKNPFTKRIKEVSSKKKKSETDFEAMSRLEWEGGLYLNADQKIIIPGRVIESTIYTAASSIMKTGRKIFKSSVFVFDDSVLEYQGPKDIEKLYDNPNFVFTTAVRVQNSRIMRTRPIFPSWSVKVAISYFTSEINEDQVIQAVVYGGRLVGLCDFRPRYGRYELE